MTVQQRPQSVGFPGVDSARPLVQSPTAAQGDGRQSAAQHGDPELQAELLAALKETREACAALMRVVRVRRDGPHVTVAWMDELRRIGVGHGFGARADALILRLEGRL